MSADWVDPKGTYVNLFHGRKTPTEQVEDWGENGPILGPFESVGIVYGGSLKMASDRGGIWFIDLVGDCYYYDGQFYGDIEIMSGLGLINWRESNHAWKTRTITNYDEAKAKVPDEFKVKKAQN